MSRRRPPVLSPQASLQTWHQVCCWLLCVWLVLPLPAEAQPAEAPVAETAIAFTLKIDAPEAVADLLERHLELQHYKDLHDLDATELQRLLDAADTQARDLLATQGHFQARLQWRTESGPDRGPGPRWRLHLQVDPGPVAQVQAVHWTFEGHLQTSEHHRVQREALQQQWAMPIGHAFTQDAWQQAKAAALRQLTAEHYPLGQWVRTEAQVDPEQGRVVLALTLDSGPEVFIGPTRITGPERYSLEQVERLANLPRGRSYRQSDLLEAQQRLVLSGFYDAVFVTLDTEGPPEAMPVRIELKETPRQRWQLGVGVRSDTGPRLTLEHTQHRVPGLDWRSVAKLSVDRVLQSASLDLLAPPDADLWRWSLGTKAEHQQFDGYEVSSQRLRAGRTQPSERLDRSHYLQYDHAQTEGNQNDTRNALSVHYAWTWRDFDTLPFPNHGWGMGLELGAGVPLGATATPYLRSLVKVLGLLPVGSQGHRLSLRGSAGAVDTRQVDDIPVTQLFVAGGEHPVRGYAPGSIGVPGTSGSVTAGRYLLTGSAEWLTPIRTGERRTDWDSVVFIDAGAVTNEPARWNTAVGLGLGARWRSPVGPLEIDLARALQTQRWRLHVSIGFRF